MLNSAEVKEAVLRWLARPQYVPAKMLVVAQQIGILKEDFQDFQKLIRSLHKKGLIRFGAGHVLWPVMDAELDERRVVGYFKRRPEGYGFVSEVELNPNAENIADDDEDIFIPPGKSQDASTGDFVSVILDEEKSVSVSHRTRRGSASIQPGDFGKDAGSKSRGRRRGRSGVIEKVLERKTRSFVGTYTENSSGEWVEVDGRVFSDPLRITDAAGCTVQPGDKVVVEILSFPAPWRTGEAVITEVLGPRGDLKTDTLAVMRQFDLPDKFNDEILTEARAQAEHFEKWEDAHSDLLEGANSEDATFCSEDEPDWIDDGRRNLRDLFTITIDPATARDFDDAISIETLKNGNWRLAVHIADVSHFVQPDSRLDREAFDRGNSVYLPDHVIPMLPEMLCNGIASLQPDRLRFTKTTFMTFSPSGVCLDVEVCDSVICSNARLNYEQVDRFFAGDTSELPERVQEALTRFRTLAKILRDRRTAKGKLDINLPEIRLDLDRDGRVIGVTREENTESHQMIEEFMVSTNEAIAQELVSAGSNLMRRIHKAPSMEKLDALGLFLEELGITMAQKADRFELQRILEKTKGTPNEFAVHQAVLKAMTRAEYSPEEQGHYALASECYCHFTSPIRRYADLTIHRQIESFILGESPKRNFRKIYDEGKHLSYCESNAEEAERELTRMKMIRFFSEKGDVELDARIVGVTHYGFFVECEQYPISGLVSIDSLPEDRYRYDIRSQTLAGFRKGNAFRLGDSVRVRIGKIDANRREINFELVIPGLKSRSTVPFDEESKDLSQTKKFPSWNELDGAEGLEVSDADGRPVTSHLRKSMETIHARVGSKKVRKAMLEMESEGASGGTDGDSHGARPSGKRGSTGRSTGSGGGKKSRENKKMTRKCKNCAPKGRKRS